jgi:3-isopropylmalate/(R)-2-methylmalate dehydratase large subunit
LGHTIIEKIIQAHSTEDVRAGRIVWMDLDVRSARDFGGANVVQHFRREYPGAKVADPEKTTFTFDCVAPANTIPYATNQHLCRLFAREQGLRVYDVDSGIGSHVLIEEGLALPGSTVVGTDSHLNILGAVGAFGQGMGDGDIAFAFKAGRTWFEVPETIKVLVKGTFEYPATAKDLTLAVLKRFGADGCLGKAVEFYGKAIESLNLAGRITLASMATEMGAIAALIPPSSAVIEELERRSKKHALNPVLADLDAVYSQTVTLDVSGLPPLASRPGHPEDVVEVSALKDVKIDSAFIGSCTNGRYEDFKVAAEILRDKKLAPGIMAKAVPATKEVFGRLLEDGLIATLFTAGVIVSHSGCGGCASGQIGMTGKGEVQVSTSNRNFRGKQGDGETFLVSPATAAASAIAGRIVSADEI